jgi:ParB family chromosome partitioning protein
MPCAFDPAFPIDRVNPAPYNPRRISPEAQARLDASLRRWGAVKPVIVNGNGTIIAGHQRTSAARALGFVTLPAVVMSSPLAPGEEIPLNQTHNSVETGNSTVRLARPVPRGWSVVPWREVLDETPAGAPRGRNVSAMARLVQRFGEWGSVLATTSGRVVANSDYAAACRHVRAGLLVYALPDGDAEACAADLAGDYGEYSYAGLDLKPYRQVFSQPLRLAEERAVRDGKPATRNVSQFHEDVIAAGDKGLRILDFGAGRKDYVSAMRAQGFRILGYEPFLRLKGRPFEFALAAVVLDLRRIEADVRAHGLFDLVICNFVVNSTTSPAWERAVLLACSGFTRAGGRLLLSYRILSPSAMRETAKVISDKRRYMHFVDRDGTSANFAPGRGWTAQRFHAPEVIEARVGTLFRSVRRLRSPQPDQGALEAEGPLPVAEDELRAALDLELNMEYPRGYKHNAHGPLRDLVLSLQGAK